MNFEKYAVQIPYPDRPKKPTLASSLPTAAGARAYADALDQWDKDMITFREAEKAYREADHLVQLQFQNDVLKENGLENHPAAYKVYSLAWDEGHANGYSEVASWVEKLADFARDIETCIIAAQQAPKKS